MTSLRLQQLTKRFGHTTAVDHVDLLVEAGELFFLIGPSGSGKTTLLRMLAGFHMPDEGRVWFGDEEVTALPPHRRSAGMVFQSVALWPHMSVGENVAFGLEQRNIARAERLRLVEEALDLVHLSGLAKRRPDELSGGQRQRVALARALVVRPRCLLLDEPFSNLDARLRQELRTEIRRVSKESALTTIFVTHDQKEALSVADRVGILDQGRILQVGTPRELYRRPVTVAAATFLGDADLIPGTVMRVDSEQAWVATGWGEFRGVLGDPASAPGVGAEVTLAIRPECWKRGLTNGTSNTIRGRISGIVYLGETASYEVTDGERTIKILELDPKSLAPPESAVQACADPKDVVVLVR